MRSDVPTVEDGLHLPRGRREGVSAVPAGSRADAGEVGVDGGKGGPRWLWDGGTWSCTRFPGLDVAGQTTARISIDGLLAARRPSA